MKIEKEIEFKTEITETEYNVLINKFNLNEKIYKLTTYYFETIDKFFYKNNKTVRIRETDNSFTLTLKSKTPYGSLEKHICLDSHSVLNMILYGFNLKNYFNIDKDVYPHGKLTTYRSSIPYNNGILFFDKFVYYGITNYEIEFEALNYDEGLKNFNEFLNSEQIAFIPTIKKSRKVFEYIEKKSPSKL